MVNSIFAKLTVLILACLSLECLHAQPPSRTIQLDILLEGGTSPQLLAREWAGVFQKFGHSPTFRQGRQGERAMIEDYELRDNKGVKVIGLLERQGAISFPGQTFVLTQEDALKAWLDKLEAFGAKGPPNEHPTWGLSEEQYAEVLKLLSGPVDGEVDFSNAMKVIESIRLPTEFKLKVTPAAAQRAFKSPEYIGDSRPDVSQYSKGTALAAALAHFGLGYRPLHNEGGKYFIEIDVGGEIDNMYPVGWNNTAPLTSVVPNIAKPIPVDLEGVPVDSLIQVLSKTLELPLLYSSAALKNEAKDLSTIKYSRKPDKLSPYRLMNVLGSAQKIGLSVRTDEAGKSFLWVTTKTEFEAFKKRFR